MVSSVGSDKLILNRTFFRLKTRPTLISLKIGSNAIETKGAQALSLALPFSRLRLLDIHNNRIADQGTKKY